jgi:hypothetical protein
MTCFRILHVIQSGAKADCHKKQHVKYRVQMTLATPFTVIEMVIENHTKGSLNVHGA